MQKLTNWILRQEGTKGNCRAFLYLCWFYLFTQVLVFAQEPYHAQSPSTQTRMASTTTAPEITITGSVQQLTVHGAVHLLLESKGAIIDALLGSSLSPELQKALSVGSPVQVAGVFKTADGKQLLLVRQLSVAGATITLRNSSEFPVLTRKITAKSVSNGGAQ